MNIDFVKIPKCLIQNWILSNFSYGAYNMVLARINNKLEDRQLSRSQVVGHITVITTGETSIIKDLVLRESYSFLKDQGVDVPKYVEEYFNNTPELRED